MRAAPARAAARKFVCRVGFLHSESNSSALFGVAAMPRLAANKETIYLPTTEAHTQIHT